MVEEHRKLFPVFIAGIALIVMGITLSQTADISISIVLLGGLLSGISGLVMLVRIVAKW